MTIVQQVSEGNIVFRSDTLLSKRQLDDLFRNYGTVEFNGVFRTLTCGGVTINLLVKNVTYLGNPHPINKKRIQIPESWKNYLDLGNTILCGVYSGPKENFIVVFANNEFTNKSLNQSSAHVDVNEIIQSSKEKDFKSPINSNTFKIIIQKERFQYYLYEFIQNIHNFKNADDINNWQKTYFKSSIKSLNYDYSISTFNEKKPLSIKTNHSKIQSSFLSYLKTKSSARLFNRFDDIEFNISPIFGIDYQKINQLRGISNNSIFEISVIANQYQKLYNTSIIEKNILVQFHSFIYKKWKNSNIPNTQLLINNIKENGGFCQFFIPHAIKNQRIIINIQDIWNEFRLTEVSVDSFEIEHSNLTLSTKLAGETKTNNLNLETHLHLDFIHFIKREFSIRSRNRFNEIVEKINPQSGIDYSSISKIRNLGAKSIIELNELTEKFQNLNNCTIINPTIIEDFKIFIQENKNYFLIHYQKEICQYLLKNGGLNLTKKTVFFKNKRTIKLIEETWFKYLSSAINNTSYDLDLPANSKINQTDVLDLFKSKNWKNEFCNFINTNTHLNFKNTNKLIESKIESLINYWRIDLNQAFYSGNQEILKYIFIRFWKNQNESNYILFNSIHDLNLINLTKERRRQLFSESSKSVVFDLPLIVFEIDSDDTLKLESQKTRDFTIKRIEKYIFIIKKNINIKDLEIPNVIPLDAIKLFAEINKYEISKTDGIFLKKSNDIRKDNLKKIIENYVSVNEENGINSSHITEELELFGYTYPNRQIPQLISKLGVNVRQKWDWTWVMKDGSLDLDPIGLNSYSDFFRSTILIDEMSFYESITKLREYYPKYRIKNAMSLLSQLKDKTLYRIILDEMIFGNWCKVKNVNRIIYNQIKYPKSYINKTVIWPSFIEEKYGTPILVSYKDNYHWKFQVNEEIDLLDLRDFIQQISWNAFILIELNNQIQNMNGDIIQLV